MPHICQSCSMPMEDEKVFGTNKDGSKNADYCIYCYKNGEFIDKVSMEEYIDMCVPFHDQAGMTEEQMRHHCETVFPTLKRWKKSRTKEKNMNYILVADKQEADNLKIPNKLKDNVKIILLGWGATSSIKTLSKMLLNGEITKNDKIFNIGYVGSNEFPIGSVVIIGKALKENPSHTVKEPPIKLDDESKVKCYSSLNFVESTKHIGVFDMELYTLASFFKKIKSVKIVSDNLNYHEYKQASIESAWQKANKILFQWIEQ